MDDGFDDIIDESVSPAGLNAKSPFMDMVLFDTTNTKKSRFRPKCDHAFTHASNILWPIIISTVAQRLAWWAHNPQERGSTPLRAVTLFFGPEPVQM